MTLLQEIQAKCQELIGSRNFDAIAAAVNVDRKKLVPTEIGIGTIVQKLRGMTMTGGQMLDTLAAIGASNRDVFWMVKLIEQSKLRIDLAETRAGMQELAAAPGMPSGFAESMTKLLELGYADDHVTAQQVNQALVDDGGNWIGG